MNGDVPVGPGEGHEAVDEGADLAAAIETIELFGDRKALARTVEEPPGKPREDALIGITGIRRGLFPNAAPYGDEPAGEGRLVA